jgi:transmembrane sensor
VVKEKLNSFVFDKVPLGEVIKSLSEKFNVEIIFTKDKIKDCKLTATFESENLENIISVIAETFNLTVVHQKNGIVLSGEGCE